MLSEEQKTRIESLSVEEMAYEIERGHRSRFQSDKFAYLKSIYSQRMAGNESSSHEISNANSQQAPLKNNEPWHNRLLGKITIGVVVIVLGAGVLYLLRSHLGIAL